MERVEKLVSFLTLKIMNRFGKSNDLTVFKKIRQFDTSRLYFAMRERQELTKIKEEMKGKPNTEIEDALNGKHETMVDEYEKILAEKLHVFQSEFVRDSLVAQVHTMFKHVHAMGGLDPYPRSFDWSDSMVDKLLEKDMEDEIRRKEAQLVEQPLPHPDGFNLKICYSSVDHPEAGFGVKTDGTIFPGTLLGFYPGTVYFPTNIKDHLDDFKDNNYTIARYDGICVNGKDWSRKAAETRKHFRQASQFTTMQSDTMRNFSKYRNPFGIANFINHPPPDQLANVVCFPFDFTVSGMPEKELQDFIPNTFATKVPTLYKDSDILMRSVACISIYPILEGEELFLNYRYSPDNAYPGWYSQPDEAEARMRWESEARGPGVL